MSIGAATVLGTLLSILVGKDGGSGFCIASLKTRFQLRRIRHKMLG